MLAVSRYEPGYVQACHGKIARAQAAFAGGPPALEHEYFRAQVLALDHYFDHRQRSNEGKDGNPLNELRILCNSFMQGDEFLLPDTQIKHKPEKSVLGIAVGEKITLTAEGFGRLADAVFAEVLKRYP